MDPKMHISIEQWPDCMANVGQLSGSPGTDHHDDERTAPLDRCSVGKLIKSAVCCKKQTYRDKKSSSGKACAL